MKANFKVAIALVVGAAIGGAAIQGLHAQGAKLKAWSDSQWCNGLGELPQRR
jgi:hypothetical protein